MFFVALLAANVIGVRGSEWMLATVSDNRKSEAIIVIFLPVQLDHCTVRGKGEILVVVITPPDLLDGWRATKR